MHISKKKNDIKNCNELRSVGFQQENKMKNVDSEKYLGDYISNDGSNEINIEERWKKRIGIVSQVISILKEVTLGFHYFKTGLLYRNTNVVNGLLFNSEIWYNLSKNQIEKIENIDEQYLRQLLGAHSKTPKEALHLETGTLPFRYIIMARRVNYLHYLLRLNNDELLYKFFKAQEEFPGKNDWILTVKENLNHCPNFST